MKNLLQKIKVVLTAAPTYMTAAAVVVTEVSSEVAQLLPEQAEEIGAVSFTVVAWITASVRIVRRVTPVLPEARGLLPQTLDTGRPVPATLGELTAKVELSRLRRTLPPDEG